MVKLGGFKKLRRYNMTLRVGRQVLKAIMAHHADTLEVVTINDLFDAQTNAHLFKYDSNYRIYHGHGW
jgi:glyceraldehyde 3-phosphate dehydrogenase